MRPPSELPKLSESLRKALATKGYDAKMAANELGFDVLKVRQWLSKNRFPVEELRLLAQLASMPLPPSFDELEKFYRFELSRPKKGAAHVVPPSTGAKGQKFNLTQMVKFFDQRLEALDPSGRIYENFGQDVESVFGAMAENDVFVFWSVDQLPFEMRPENGLIRREIANALEKGAYFVYMHPSSDLLGELETDSGISDLRSEGSFNKIFDEFKNELCALHRDARGAEERVASHVVKVRAAGPAFAAPTHRFVLFIPNNPESGPRGFARFPTGNEVSSKELHLSLSPIVTGQLLAFFKKSLRDADDANVAARTELLGLVR